MKNGDLVKSKLMAKQTLILNVAVSATNYEKTLLKIRQWIENKRRSYICVSAVHLVMECQKNLSLLIGVNRAGLVTPDGMPLVWLSKLYGKKEVKRVYGPTLMLKLCKLAELKKYKIFLLGGSVGQTKILKEKLLQQFRKLNIVGIQDTPVRPFSFEVNKNIIKKINNSHAQIVFVGLGCPLQEQWIIDNRKLLKPEVLIGVGAAFDFISGEVKQASIFLQTLGLEWLFRLIHDPRRLFYRYLALNSLFCLLILKQLFTDFITSRIIHFYEEKNTLFKSNVPVSS